jgi:hypothetical protein
LQKLTTTEVIDAYEEDNNPRPVAASTANIAAASLIDRASDKESGMSLDLEGWMSPKWLEIGDLHLAVREPPLYTVAKFEARRPNSSRRVFAVPHFPRWLRGNAALIFAEIRVAR